MQSATQASSSSRSNAAIVTTVDPGAGAHSRGHLYFVRVAVARSLLPVYWAPCLTMTCLALAQTTGEIQELYELEAKQGEEIKDLSEQLFAAAWQASMSTPRDIQHRCLGQMTDVLGEGVGQLVHLDGKYLRKNGKLPERSPSWDFGDLVPG
ncbi:hypothetical protein NLJ89_g10095 [Agrocybe chaxingu]|uniref:Uncharacterized protein n=1 Tax=Agrocybe chaxingu TaxID=84603 RepID=A0A9W8JUS4_9AGAR|nr:hypothetical protein NLJ89_g10095 [Agrocybe chaxingu]